MPSTRKRVRNRHGIGRSKEPQGVCKLSTPETGQFKCSNWSIIQIYSGEKEEKDGVLCFNNEVQAVGSLFSRARKICCVTDCGMCLLKGFAEYNIFEISNYCIYNFCFGRQLQTLNLLPNTFAQVWDGVGLASTLHGRLGTYFLPELFAVLSRLVTPFFPQHDPRPPARHGCTPFGPELGGGKHWKTRVNPSNRGL